MASSTTNLGLTLPVGGEHVSRQIINANNVKIDEAVGPVPSGTDLQSQVTALNSNITNIKEIYGIGQFSSLADVNSALTTYTGQMAAQETRPIMVSTLAAFAPFKTSETYQGQIYKWSSNRYYVILVSVSNTITGTYLLGTWTWKELALKSETPECFQRLWGTSLSFELDYTNHRYAMGFLANTNGAFVTIWKYDETHIDVKGLASGYTCTLGSDNKTVTIKRTDNGNLGGMFVVA